MFASKRLREWAWATVVTVVLALTITTVAVVVAPTAAASLNELNLQDDVPGGALRIFGVSRVMSRSVFPVVEGANGGGHDGNDGGDATTGDESVGGVLMGLPNSLKLVLLVIIFGILVLAIISCCRVFFAHMRDACRSVMNSLHVSFSFGDRDRYSNISTSDETELETVVVEEV